MEVVEGTHDAPVKIQPTDSANAQKALNEDEEEFEYDEKAPDSKEEAGECASLEYGTKEPEDDSSPPFVEGFTAPKHSESYELAREPNSTNRSNNQED